jgi:hypothetical protein
MIYSRLKNLPVHRSCAKSPSSSTNLQDLSFNPGQVPHASLGLHCRRHRPVLRLAFARSRQVRRTHSTIILLFSIVGIAGSYGVAWFGIRVNTFANSRTAFAALRGKPYPIYHIPLEAGMSIGMMLISVELLMMLFILLFIPGDYAGRASSASPSANRSARGAAHRRRHLHQDRRHRLRPDEDRLQDQGRRRAQPGVIADCTGDNAGDSVGPSADGFETYGVTGVALITFILLAVHDPTVQVQLLVWIFVMRIVMLIASRCRLLHQRRYCQSQVRQRRRNELRGAAHFSGLDYLHRLHRPDLSDLFDDHPEPRRGHVAVVEARDHHFLRHARRRRHSRTRQGFHLHRIAPRERSCHLRAEKVAHRSASFPVSSPEISPLTTSAWPWSS